MAFHSGISRQSPAAIRQITAALVLATAAGCGQQSPAEFNNSIVRCNYQVRDAGLRFAEALERTRRSRDSAQLRRALADWLAAVENARKQIDRLSPLDDGESRDFLNAERDYLAALEELIRNEYGRIPKILDDAHLDAAEKDALLADIETSARARETAVQQKLAVAQKAFAHKHALTLWPTSPQ